MLSQNEMNLTDELSYLESTLGISTQSHPSVPSNVSLGWGSFVPHKSFQDLDGSQDKSYLDFTMENSSDQMPRFSMEMNSALTQSLARNALEAASHLYINHHDPDSLMFLNQYSMYHHPSTPEDNLDSQDPNWLALNNEFGLLPNYSNEIQNQQGMITYSNQHQLIGLPSKTDLGPWVRIPRQKPTLLSQDPTQPLLYCKFCHQPFSRRNSLRRHELLHTGVKPYVCTPCGRSFSRQDIFKRHCSSRRCQKLTLTCTPTSS